MAKQWGVLAAHTTGTTAIGVLKNFEVKKSASVTYGKDANGEPDSDNGGVREPETISCELEVNGTVPEEKDTITIGTDVYIITSVSDKYVVAEAETVTIEATEQQTA